MVHVTVLFGVPVTFLTDPATSPTYLVTVPVARTRMFGENSRKDAAKTDIRASGATNLLTGYSFQETRLERDRPQFVLLCAADWAVSRSEIHATTRRTSIGPSKSTQCSRLMRRGREPVGRRQENVLYLTA